MRIQFFIPLKKVPTVTAQEKRITVRRGKPVVYDDWRIIDAKSLFCGWLDRHRPKEPIKGPVQLFVEWWFPYSGKQHIDGEPKITRPDTDNLQKLFKDCMTKVGYWKDDAQVYREHIGKVWNKTGGIHVMVEWEEDEEDKNEME